MAERWNKDLQLATPGFWCRLINYVDEFHSSGSGQATEAYPWLRDKVNKLITDGLVDPVTISPVTDQPLNLDLVAGWDEPTPQHTISG